MNTLATELNEVLADTVVGRLFSDFGKRIYFPKGIVAQSAEADRKASRFNATVGMAYSHGHPVILPALHRLLSDLSAKEAVAYAPTAGIPELRDLWQREMTVKNPGLSGKKILRPIVTPGLTNGIYQAASLFFDAGDVVVIPDMFWGNYRLIFEEQKGGRVVSFPFFTAEGGLNTASLRDVLRANSSNGRVALLLNFPNNPTGYSPTTEEVDEIVNIITAEADRGTDVLVISDDAYFGLFYEAGTCTESIFSRLADCHERVLAVKVDGATKEEFVWGFRVGFMTVASRGLSDDHYAAIEKKIMGAIRSTISNSSGLAQNLLVRVMKSPTYREEKRAEFQVLNERYRKVRSILEARKPGGSRREDDRQLLEPLPFNSGYFMSFKCHGVGADAVRQELLKGGIGVISIQDKYLRIAFASIDVENLNDLFDEVFAAAERVAAAAD